MNRLITLSLLVASLCIGQTRAVVCYTCHSKISVDNVETPELPTTENCATISSSTKVTADLPDMVCTTSFTTNNGETDIVRGAVFFGNRLDFPYCDGATCYCSSDRCNSETARPPSSLQCYECGSSDYFDNGCGEELDSSLKHVAKVSGCSACGKSKTYSGYVVRYSRDCIRGVEVEEGCIGEDEKCTCKTSLCNGASHLHFAVFSLVAAFALSVAAKIF